MKSRPTVSEEVEKHLSFYLAVSQLVVANATTGLERWPSLPGTGTIVFLEGDAGGGPGDASRLEL
jgi:hypothetical protein